MATDYVDAGVAVDNSALSHLTGSAPPVAKGVTYERILNARSEPHNWLTYYGAYDGQRYSPLDQINKENVKRIAPQWVFQAGSVGLHSGKSTYSFEASPIVVDGVMFVSGWDGWVWALDARNGDLLWQYRHAIPFDVSLCCGNVNRGVAVAQGMVFVVTLNAHIIALDAATGKKVWDQTYGDVRAGESATVAPLIVKDMVIVGSSGGEFGNRGHSDAFKLETGERVWRTYMVPKPGEPGSETWPDDGEAWQRGGANCWVTPTYDPDLNLIYYGTGNPCPDFDGGVREGDNLHTDSGVAIDADTGEIKAHFQYTPHDLWDYDSVMEHILFDLDGQKLAAHFDKNGFMYILDRTNMQPVRVAPFVDRIDWGEVDEKGNVTPKIYPDAEGDPVHFWPGPAGAKEWTHACYNPNTELLYCPVQDVGATATRRRRDFKESIPYWGAGVAVDLEDMAGSISAFDPRTGAERWRWSNDIPMCSSLLTTGGGLVFGGEPTGEFNALDAESGDLLYQFQCGSGHHSSPCSYSVDGRQYIAVPTGWGAWTEGFLPGMLGARQGSSLFVFALPED
jgi:alcohol dehydrogenase (cytochrome c)